MKKNTIFTAFLFLAGILTVSCERSLPDIGIKEEQKTISFKPVTGNGNITKAAIDGTVFPTSNTMKVMAYFNGAEGCAAGDYFPLTTFSRSESTWEGGRYWPQVGTLNFLAYSVSDASVIGMEAATSGAVRITLGIGDNSSTQCDILHARANNQKYNSAGNPFEFRHSQALIVFTASSTVAYNATTNYGITINSITLKDAKYSGTLQISNSEISTGHYCTWYSLGDQKNKTLPGLSSYNVPVTAMDITAAGNHMGIGGIGILVPEQSATSFTVNYTLHNGKNGDSNVDNTLQYTGTLSGEWEENKKYCYQLQFAMNSITFAPTVLDWNTAGQIEMPIPDPANGHAYVDLGLRSGGNKILFATMNVGASNPEEDGDYFAWAETSKRYTTISEDNIIGATFEYANCPYHTVSTYNTGWTKYIPTAKTSYWSGDGSPDNLLTLEAFDDIASVSWGGEWRMPDKADLEFLISPNVAYNWTNNYNSTGIDGLIVTGKGSFADASIFLPAAGQCNASNVYNSNRIYYWSRTLNDTAPQHAYFLFTGEGGTGTMNFGSRALGQTIRPVLVVPE